jgi:hypothetical protein
MASPPPRHRGDERQEDVPIEAVGVDGPRRFTRRKALKRIGLSLAGAVAAAVAGGVGVSIYASRKRPLAAVDLDTVASASIAPLPIEEQRRILADFLGRHGSPLHTFEKTMRTLAEASRVTTRDGREHVDLTFLPEWAGETGKPKSYKDAEPVTFRLSKEGEVEGVLARSHWNLIWAGSGQFRNPGKPEVTLSPGFHTPVFDLGGGDWPHFIPQGGRSEVLSRDTYLTQAWRTGGTPARIDAEAWKIGSLEKDHPGRGQPWH